MLAAEALAVARIEAPHSASATNPFHDLRARLARIASLAQALRMAAESVADAEISEPFAAMAIVIFNHLNDLSEQLDAFEREQGSRVAV